MINMIIHDTNQGVLSTESANDAKIYGNLFYYNGYDAPDRGHGHGIYVQNLSTPSRQIFDNIIFEQFGWGIHAYTENGNLDNLDFQGNVSFNNGWPSGGYHANILVGGLQVAHSPKLISNYTYNFDQANKNDVGYAAGCTNPNVTNNYFVSGQALDFNNCTGMTITGNTFVGSISGFSQSAFPSNTYYGSTRPTGIKVFVRPNAYEAGRANIVIYNWDLQNTVSVDVSSILSPGDGFEVRNAADFFAAPVLSGTYSGGSISLPMNGLSVAPGVGFVAPDPTGPEYNVFVLLPASGGGTPSPTPSSTATSTATATRTPTSLPPTATRTPTSTFTAVPPTSTATRTTIKTRRRPCRRLRRRRGRLRIRRRPFPQRPRRRARTPPRPPTATRTPSNTTTPMPPTATPTHTATRPPDRHANGFA